MFETAFLVKLFVLLVWAASAAQTEPGEPQGAEEKARFWAERLKSDDQAMVLKAVQKLGILTYKGTHSQIVKPHLTRITELLKNDKPEIRAAAIPLLSNLKSTESTPQIGELLKDANPDVKKAAIGALEYFKATAYTGEIAKSLQDRDFGLRGTAVNALGSLGAREHAEEMRKLLGDENFWVRGLTASALAKFGKEHANDIAGLLKSKERDKINAIHALRSLKAKEFAGEIAGLLKDEDHAVRGAALWALRDFGAKEYAGEVAQLLDDKNDAIRKDVESMLRAWNISPEEARKMNPGAVTPP